MYYQNTTQIKDTRQPETRTHDESLDARSTHLPENTFIEQTVLLGGHHEVVRLVLVVDDVLEVDARLGVKVLEELLVEDVGDARDLLHRRLRRRVAVDEVRRDGDGQLAAELLALKACGQDV